MRARFSWDDFKAFGEPVIGEVVSAAPSINAKIFILQFFLQHEVVPVVFRLNLLLGHFILC